MLDAFLVKKGDASDALRCSRRARHRGRWVWRARVRVRKNERCPGGGTRVTNASVDAGASGVASASPTGGHCDLRAGYGYCYETPAAAPDEAGCRVRSGTWLAGACPAESPLARCASDGLTNTYYTDFAVRNYAMPACGVANLTLLAPSGPLAGSFDELPFTASNVQIEIKPASGLGVMITGNAGALENPRMRFFQRYQGDAEDDLRAAMASLAVGGRIVAGAEHSSLALEIDGPAKLPDGKNPNISPMMTYWAEHSIFWLEVSMSDLRPYDQKGRERQVIGHVSGRLALAATPPSSSNGHPRPSRCSGDFTNAEVSVYWPTR